jgi:hypothetical protein
VRRLDDAGIDIDDVGVRHSTLDDVFFALTGHPAEDAQDHDDEGDADDEDGAHSARADDRERKSA